MTTLTQPAILHHTNFSQLVYQYAAKAEASMPAMAGRIGRAVELVLGGCVEPIGNSTGAPRFEVASQTTFPDRWFTVRSQSSETTYDIVQNVCNCADYEQHATQTNRYACKHIIATWLYRRVVQALENTMPETPQNAPESTSATPLTPEPSSQDELPVDDVEAIHGRETVDALLSFAQTFQRECAQPLPQTMAALPEAPASVNCTVVIHGHKLMITIRDTQEECAMERMLALLERYAAK